MRPREGPEARQPGAWRPFSLGLGLPAQRPNRATGRHSVAAKDRVRQTPIRCGTIWNVAIVGDRVQVPSRRSGEAPRDGVVTGVAGSLLSVRWSTGEESTVVPSMGSLVVVGKTPLRPGGGGHRRQTKSASTAKGQVGTQAALGRLAASKQAKQTAKKSGQSTLSQTAQKAATVAAQPKKTGKAPALKTEPAANKRGK